MPFNNISSLSNTSCSEPDESESELTSVGKISYSFGFLNKLLINSEPIYLIGFNLMCYNLGEVFSESKVEVDDFLEFINKFYFSNNYYNYNNLIKKQFFFFNNSISSLKLSIFD